MEMMDSANLPFAQSTSKVDNRFNRWSAPLFKVALCPPGCRTLFVPRSNGSLDLNLDQTDSTRGSAFPCRWPAKLTEKKNVHRYSESSMWETWRVQNAILNLILFTINFGSCKVEDSVRPKWGILSGSVKSIDVAVRTAFETKTKTSV